MAIKRKLLIPPESARPREAGWLDECRQRSFAALRACPESSEGMTALPDFGDAICYYRYYRVPDELEPRSRKSAHRMWETSCLAWQYCRKAGSNVGSVRNPIHSPAHFGLFFCSLASLIAQTSILITVSRDPSPGC